MSDPARVAPQPRGLELFAAPRRRTPLKITGKRLRGLEKLKISTVQDLLQHYPRYHVDRTEVRTIRELGRLGVRASLV